MKTLRYSWLGLFIVLAIVIIALKEYPNLISYDYYYTKLKVEFDLQGADLDDQQKRDDLINKIKAGLETSLEKYTHEDLANPEQKIKSKELILSFDVKMKNFSNCYFYLVHHRKIEDLLFKELTPEYITGFTREWDHTELTQKGALNSQELKLVGSYNAKLTCRL